MAREDSQRRYQHRYFVLKVGGGLRDAEVVDDFALQDQAIRKARSKIIESSPTSTAVYLVCRGFKAD